MTQPIMRFKHLLHELDSESDRAAVILAAAMLDELLLDLLRSSLSPCPSGKDELLDSPNAPFGSFSTRINGCHRIGLITTTFAKDLHIIRRTRNEFAHNISGATFAMPRIQARISSLCSSHGLFER